jgi:hypothetical protein
MNLYRTHIDILHWKNWLMTWLMKFGSARGVCLWDIRPRIAQKKSDAVFVSDMVIFGKIVLIGSKANLLNGFPER